MSHVLAKGPELPTPVVDVIQSLGDSKLTTGSIVFSENVNFEIMSLATNALKSALISSEYHVFDGTDMSANTAADIFSSLTRPMTDHNGRILP